MTTYGLFTIIKGLKPLIKWSGGKYREIVRFKHHYPNNFKRYIEPFVGGGAVFFDLNFDGENIISDVHIGLINFYNQIKLGNSVEIYDRVSKLGCDEKTYYTIRDNEIAEDDGLEGAVKFYYIRKTCFRGMLRYNSKRKFNIPFGNYNSFNAVKLSDERYEQLLKHTDIRSYSFEKIFEEFNDGSNFLFLDPPYDSTFTDYGYCSFGKKHHKELAENFKKTKNKCLMVIGKSDLIEDTYRDYIVDSYDKTYMFKIHSGRVGNEINNKHLVIKNY